MSLSTQMLSNAFSICIIWEGSLFSLFGMKEECEACKANQIIQNINSLTLVIWEKVLKWLLRCKCLLYICAGECGVLWGFGLGKRSRWYFSILFLPKFISFLELFLAAVVHSPFWNVFRSRYWGLVSARLWVNSCYFYCVYVSFKLWAEMPHPSHTEEHKKALYS